MVGAGKGCFQRAAVAEDQFVISWVGKCLRSMRHP